jgi:hypothetical protein
MPVKLEMYLKGAFNVAHRHLDKATLRHEGLTLALDERVDRAHCGLKLPYELLADFDFDHRHLASFFGLVPIALVYVGVDGGVSAISPR